MKKLLSLFLLFSVEMANTQDYVDRIGFKLESIEDIDIGWMKIHRFTSAPTAKQHGDRRYTAAQMEYRQQFVEWIQQSYTPRGCLGSAGYYLNALPDFSPTNGEMRNAINSQLQALPNLYGAQGRMYMFLKKDAAGKFVPQNNLSEYWRIEANQVQYISEPVWFISSPEEYYFVLPDYKSHPKGYDADDRAASNLSDFDKHPNIAAYRHFYIPPKIISDDAQYVVIMTKDNELPFEKVTIGEFFTQAEKQLAYWQTIRPLSAEELAKAKKNLARLKEKYQSKWNEVAELLISNAQMSQFNFVNASEGYDDFFAYKEKYGKNGASATFPILKVKKEARERCKTGGPQWLVIRWTMGMPNQAYNQHLHESVLNNFNFEYAYNYFFNPDKVKGQPYKPLRSPLYREPVVVKDASEESKKNKADKNVVFYDDFSTNAIGKKPNGWRAELNAGRTALVSKPDGLEGTWVELKGHEIQLKLPGNFPQDFTLSYELAALKISLGVRRAWRWSCPTQPTPMIGKLF